MYRIQYKEKAGSDVRDWHVTVIRQVLETVKQLLANSAVEITITEIDNDKTSTANQVRLF